MHLSRRQFLKSAGLGAAVIAAPQLLHAKNAKPNIIFILVDDLGYGDLSSYGAKDLQTPNIDKLVTAGMRFDYGYANCPVCSPTRASVLTGRYPDLVGVPGVIRTHKDNSWGYLSQKAVLLPEVLKKVGYNSAIVGKWHLGLESPNTPTERGFDFFHGYLGDMMDDYYTHRRHGINYMRRNEQVIDPKGHATDLFTQWSVDYIKEHKDSKNPFFLYLAYNAPHKPIMPPKQWLDKVKKREPGLDETRAKIVALIEHLDDGIGRVMDALKETKQDENTLIIFTSDNGGQINAGANNGATRGEKQNMFEGGIRVPTCVVWPGKIKPGSKSDRIVLTMDFYPTICQAVYVDFSHKIDGESILPTLLGETQPGGDRTLFWVRREGGNYGGRAYYAVRQGDWKLLQNTPFEPMQLYNLKDDPMEQHPLSNKHPKFKELFAALRNHIIEAGAVPWEKS